MVIQLRLVPESHAAWQFLCYALFMKVDEERTHSLIQVNIRTTVSLTHAVLPGMIKRKRGLVVNMSSGAACLPIPYIALYSATKVHTCRNV